MLLYHQSLLGLGLTGVTGTSLQVKLQLYLVPQDCHLAGSKLQVINAQMLCA